jgi:hypothetical protein
VLHVTAPPASTPADAIDVVGFATDNLNIRAVRWVNDRGGRGEAAMTWTFSGDYTVGYTWQMDWTAGGVPLQSGEDSITITVEDIKGLRTSRTVTVTRTSGLLPGGGPAADVFLDGTSTGGTSAPPAPGNNTNNGTTNRGTGVAPVLRSTGETPVPPPAVPRQKQIRSTGGTPVPPTLAKLPHYPSEYLETSPTNSYDGTARATW